MAHDVFISYSNKDKTVADAVCGKLEGWNIRCWIAPRDVQPGIPFAASLLHAIRDSRVCVLILSEDSNHSVHVLREVSEAVDCGIPIVPFRISEIELSEEMHYYIKSIHWLDAITPPLERHLLKLGKTVQALLSVSDDQLPITQAPSVDIPTIKRGRIPAWIIISTFIVLVAIVLGVVYKQKALSPPTTQVASQTAYEEGIPTPIVAIRPTTQVSIPITTEQQETPTTDTVAPLTTSIVGDPGQIIDGFGVPMVLIPGGPFRMGSKEGDSDEQPEHDVTLDSFYIDVYEVTNELFERFLNEVGNREEGGTFWLEPGIIFHRSIGWTTDPRYTDHPVVMVSWYGAKAYCEWRGARLPTDAEWEKAARGGLEGKMYPWGDDPPVRTPGTQNGAQYGDRGDTTVPVGSFAPNGYGLYDMAGNVIEWVSDWYDDDYYAESPYENPTGPETSNSCVIRDGSWANTAYELRVSARHWSWPEARYTNYGFRCARSN